MFIHPLFFPDLKTSSIKLGGHGGHFEIKPSQWQWTKFKDFVHFYVMVGAVPCLAVMFLSNIYVGPATLTEVPEGYTPQHWEYHKHPITRFFAKYLHQSPQEVYEKKMARLYEKDELQKMRTLTMKLDELMRSRNDTQVYYYRPISTTHFRQREEEAEQLRDQLGGSHAP
ncbi:hypothetical protein WDU94_005290 [Cyamophila willieti]